MTQISVSSFKCSLFVTFAFFVVKNRSLSLTFLNFSWRGLDLGISTACWNGGGSNGHPHERAWKHRVEWPSAAQEWPMAACHWQAAP